MEVTLHSKELVQGGGGGTGRAAGAALPMPTHV
jgi:hypothetical protein